MLKNGLLAEIEDLHTQLRAKAAAAAAAAAVTTVWTTVVVATMAVAVVVVVGWPILILGLVWSVDLLPEITTVPEVVVLSSVVGLL